MLYQNSLDIQAPLPSYMPHGKATSYQSGKNYFAFVGDSFTAGVISGLGIKYYPALEKCNWSEDMFFTRDAHPDMSGYDNMTKCVSDYMFK
jgi:hypothetical protein